jgi:hypothetical protein
MMVDIDGDQPSPSSFNVSIAVNSHRQPPTVAISRQSPPTNSHRHRQPSTVTVTVTVSQTGLRERILPVERELLGKVFEDPRFSKSRQALAKKTFDLVSQQLENPLDDGDGDGDGDNKQLVPYEGAVVVPTVGGLLEDWQKECVRVCIENWEVELLSTKLKAAHERIKKLESDKIDAHRAYMQELHGLRDRIRYLERRDKIDYDVTMEDLFY